MIGQKERPSAVIHLKHTIQILNERFRDFSQEGTGDSTIAAVALLALTEQSSENHENWRTHMRGIKRMVELRGGLSGFEGNPILDDILYRADIWGSVYGLSKPYLQVDGTTLLKSPLKTDTTLPPGFKALHNQNSFSPAFLEILNTLQTITHNLNRPNPPKSELIPLQLRHRIQSIQYSLLHTYRCISNPLLKACYLGILLYVGIIQNEFWIPSISDQILGQLKACLSFVSGALRLWLLFLAGLVGGERVWVVCEVVTMAEEMGMEGWGDVRAVLEGFGWVGYIMDEDGRKLWDDVVRIRSALL
ncbi:uncharacterized protein LY89DRAFT_774430 [Mollisia scopiformis]|uniref:Uncharacterized protein n=1 Tax=Mollisia scopiformis TaxID=149040 RepID=A0A194XEH3_MOLSC|nr:uncharacterized protein LY89DRAFT_774430 [Mollisia scopiformis]KUJ18590.1 hypothetical protein LY89DRAFT_774430 [Mollisia scopiformis]